MAKPTELKRHLIIPEAHDDPDTEPTPMADSIPKYRLEATCYLDDRQLEPDAIIYWTGPVGWYMKPLNKAAQDRWAKEQPRMECSIDTLNPDGSKNSLNIPLESMQPYRPPTLSKVVKQGAQQ